MTHGQSSEQVLSEVVSHWVALRFPKAEGAPERAGAIAVQRYQEGATVDEACGEAVAFVGSWLRHPSSAPVRPFLRSA